MEKYLRKKKDVRKDLEQDVKGDLTEDGIQELKRVHPQTWAQHIYISFGSKANANMGSAYLH